LTGQTRGSRHSDPASGCQQMGTQLPIGDRHSLRTRSRALATGDGRGIVHLGAQRSEAEDLEGDQSPWKDRGLRRRQRGRRKPDASTEQSLEGECSARTPSGARRAVRTPTRRSGNGRRRRGERPCGSTSCLRTRCGRSSNDAHDDDAIASPPACGRRGGSLRGIEFRSSCDSRHTGRERRVACCGSALGAPNRQRATATVLRSSRKSGPRVRRLEHRLPGRCREGRRLGVGGVGRTSPRAATQGRGTAVSRGCPERGAGRGRIPWRSRRRVGACLDPRGVAPRSGPATPDGATRALKGPPPRVGETRRVRSRRVWNRPRSDPNRPRSEGRQARPAAELASCITTVVHGTAPRLAGASAGSPRRG